MASGRFYVTTPIYYVNARPHLGHAYTTVLADVLHRYHRLFGDDSFFLTGTDEHGEKIQKAAQARNLTPREHCDEMSGRFRAMWLELDIEFSDFIRTTETRHEELVRHMLARLYDAGDIYSDDYEGWYCFHEERFWTVKDLAGGNCPDCGRPVQRLKEKNYFFRMGNYQDWLIDYIKANAGFIRPETRRNEVLGFLKQPLEDLCISRPKRRLSWGIELPFDTDYVTYVWFDALLNYVTAIGYLEDRERFDELWGAAHHLIGKDIATTHCVYWPTMLKAMGLEPPRAIVIHGWWLVESEKTSERIKMSKSLGNVIDPAAMAGRYGVDQFRFFLMREMPLGQDSAFSEVGFVNRVNSDLANDLGNGLSRTIKMTESYFGPRVPDRGPERAEDRELLKMAAAVPENVRELIGDFRTNEALDGIMAFVRRINKYIEETAPFNLIKRDPERTANVLYNALEALRLAAVLLWPVTPGRSEELCRRLGLNFDPSPDYRELTAWGGLRPGEPLSPGEALYPRLAPPIIEKEPEMPEITIEEFKKLDLRVGTIIDVEEIAGADKLFRLSVDLGEEKRTLVAGIREHYSPGELKGRQVVVIANLKPAVIRGTESKGMILAADDGEVLAFLTPEKKVKTGSRIS